MNALPSTWLSDYDFQLDMDLPIDLADEADEADDAAHFGQCSLARRKWAVCPCVPG